MEKTNQIISARLQKITGWTLLAAAVGVFWDEMACGGCTDGSLGLIPLYVGFPIGAVGFVMMMKKRYGWAAGIWAGAGLASILYFMFSYPAGAKGWIGGLGIAVASLYLQLPYRVGAVVWSAVAIFGYPTFFAMAPEPLNTFILFGIGTAILGAWALRSLEMETKE